MIPSQVGHRHMEYLLVLLPPFLATLVIESMFVTAVLWRHGSRLTILSTVVLLHCITHPVGATIYYATPLGLLFAEVTVTVAEAVAYKLFLSLPWRTVVLVSILANMLSFFLGPLIRSLIT